MLPFTPNPAPNRRRARAFLALRITLTIAFALFISVANATAEETVLEPTMPTPDLTADTNEAEQPAPPAEEKPAVVEAPVAEEQPAPVIEEQPPAPVEHPAPVIEEQRPVVEEPAPVVEKQRAPVQQFAPGRNSRVAVDVCSNVIGNQTSVPAGVVAEGGACYGYVSGCRVTRGILGNVTGLTAFNVRQDSFSPGLFDIYTWGTSKRVTAGFVTNPTPQTWNLGTSYYRFTGVGAQTQTRTGQQLLDNGCSFTPPAPVDACSNIAGNQPTVPVGHVQVGTTCVPTAVTCTVIDQTPLDDGSTTNSVANDGITDACAPNPKSCAALDETGRDTNGNGIIDTCDPRPAVCDPLDQIGVDTNGNTIIDRCDPNPVACDTGEGLVDGNHNGINDGCTPIACDAGESPRDTGTNHVADVCDPKVCDTLDEAGRDAGGNGVIDTCDFLPEPACPTGVLLDRNGNGNGDLCAVVQPSLKCKVTNDAGHTTMYWVYTTNSGMSFSVPSGQNMLFGAASGELPPASFGSSGDFTSTLPSGTGSSAWFVTGNIASGSASSSPCFPDQCPNIQPGDQEHVPAGMVHNAAGSCVTAPPVCAFDQFGTDDGSAAGTIAGDGVNDGCVNKPDVSCRFDETATDTNANGVLDTCAGNANVSCDPDERAVDTNGNGVLDTCRTLPNALCVTGVGVDTNGNGSLDLCVRVTPIIDCGVDNGNGTRTLHWRWRNSSAYTVTPASLLNIHTGGGQPTTFAPGEGSFTTILGSGQAMQMWLLTGNSAWGFANRNLTPRCFPDACPNLGGDQQSAPSGMAINNRGACVAETTSCTLTDEAPSDTDNDGVKDSCVGVPVSCSQHLVAIDTNGNGNPDTCAKVSPVLECVTNNEDGTSTALFGTNHSYGVTINVPVGSNNRFSNGFMSQPTSFATGRQVGTFTVSIAAGGGNVVWKLTSSTSTANENSKPCFEDACPNLRGDQRDVPEGYVYNKGGSCVVAAPSCDVHASFDERVLTPGATRSTTGETPTDLDGDGVADICAPVECDADQVGRDTGENQIADVCDPIPLECNLTTHVSKDLIPAGSPNGILDTCVEIGSCPTGSTWTDRNEDKVVGAGECSVTDSCGVVTLVNLNPLQDRAATGSSTSCVVCPDGTPRSSDTNGDGRLDTADCVAPVTETAAPGGAAAGSPDGGTAAGGDTSTPDDADATAGDTTTEEAPEVVAAAEADDTSGDLPFTGLALGMLALLGTGMAAGGIAMRGGARRRERERVTHGS